MNDGVVNHQMAKFVAWRTATAAASQPHSDFPGGSPLLIIKCGRKRALRTIPVFLAFLLPGEAIQAQPASCADIAPEVMERTRSSLDRTSRDGQNRFLRHPAVTDLSIDCSRVRGGPMVFGAWPQARSPSPQFYTTMATAGSVLTNRPAPPIEAALRRCQREAIRPTAMEFASQNVPNAVIECHAASGGGFTVSIYLRPDEQPQ